MPTSTMLDPRRPFTRAQALASGLTDAVLRGPGFRPVYRGVHISSEITLWPSVFIEAALLLHPPDAFASHWSAATIHQLPVPDHHQVHISVFEKADRRRREGIRPHLAVADAAVTTRLGVRVSTPLQLFLEMAGCLNLVDLVVLGDAMVKRGHASLRDLRDAAATTRMPRGDLARRAAALVREGVDSPMETRLRMLIVLAGLPEPKVNHVIRRRDGSVMLRLDLSYPGLRIAVEYDGQQHRADLQQWSDDIDRADWFDDTGWKVIKVIAPGIYRRPAQTIRRVRDALVARGCPDVPRVLSDEWRAYFPTKA
jgi:hypothetical protein